MLKDCPTEFKPALYKRYVADTFVVFRKADHVNKFLQFINSKHQNIKFTKELEDNCKLPYLYVLLEHHENEIKTSVYKKKTYTGAGIKYISHVYHNYKMNAFSTFLHRAWRVSNDCQSFHKELEVLRTYFLSNDYTEKIFYKKVRNCV